MVMASDCGRPITRMDGNMANIPGLDWEQAMLRLDGNQDLLVTMLKRIAGSLEEFVPSIRRALMDGSTDQAIRRAHSLKGNAGNLALVDLAEQAKALEAAIRDGSNDITDRLDRLAAVIAEFRRAVVTAFGDTSADLRLSEFATRACPPIAGTDSP